VERIEATSPAGETVEMMLSDGKLRVCRRSSPEVCVEYDDPEGKMMGVVLENLFHKGWRIKSAKEVE